MRHVRPHLLVDREEATFVDTNAGRVGIDPVAVRSASHRDQDAIEELLACTPGPLEADPEVILPGFYAHHPRAEMNGFVPLGESSLQRPNEIGIRTCHQFVEQLDHYHLRAECVVHTGELEADDAPADYEQALRDVRKLEGARRIHDSRILRQIGEPNCSRPDGDDGALEDDPPLPVATLNGDLLRRDEPRPAPHPLNLTFSSELVESLGQPPDDRVLPGPELVEIDLRGTEANPVIGHRGRLVDNRSGMEQCFRRDAADVQADATKCGMGLDECNRLTEVSGTERGRIAPGTGAEDDDVDAGPNRSQQDSSACRRAHRRARS